MFRQLSSRAAESCPWFDYAARNREGESAARIAQVRVVKRIVGDCLGPSAPEVVGFVEEAVATDFVLRAARELPIHGGRVAHRESTRPSSEPVGAAIQGQRR